MVWLWCLLRAVQHSEAEYLPIAEKNKLTCTETVSRAAWLPISHKIFDKLTYELLFVDTAIKDTKWYPW